MSNHSQSLISCQLCSGRNGKAIFNKNKYTIAKCSSCGLVFVANFPDDNALKEIYSFSSGYHRNLNIDSAVYDQQLRTAHRYLKLIKKYKDKGKIVDVGCSVGIFLNLAKKDGWDTCGVEFSKDTSELAHKKFGLNVYSGTIDKAEFAEKSFDIVTLWDVVEHLPNPMDTLACINKVLKNKGLLFLATPNIDGIFPKFTYAVSKITKYWPHPTPPTHLFQFSKNTITRALEKSGFQVLNIYDEMIPLKHSFKDIKRTMWSPRILFFMPLFLITALIGPFINLGDSMIIVAKKNEL